MSNENQNTTAGIRLSPGLAAAMRNGLDASNSAAEEANLRINFHTEAIQVARSSALKARQIHAALVAGIVQDAGENAADYGQYHWVEIEGVTYLRPGQPPSKAGIR